MKQSFQKQIALGAVLSYLSIGLYVVSGLVYTPLILRTIGKAEYGIFTMANSFIKMLVMDFGLSSAVTRYLSVYYGRGEVEKADQFLGLVFKLYLILSVIIGLVLFVLFFFLDGMYTSFTADELHKFKVVYCIVGLSTVLHFPFVPLGGVLYANEKFIEIQLLSIANRALTLLMVVVALISGFGLYALVLVHVFVQILTTLCQYLLIRKKQLAKPQFRFFDQKLFKEIFAFSIWVTVGSLADRLIYNITPSILGITLGTSAVAIFGVASAMESYTYSITSAVHGFFHSYVGRLYGADENADVTPLMVEVGRIEFLLFGLVFAGFFSLGQSFLQLWIGSEYNDAYIILCVILGIEVFGTVMNIGYTCLTIKNKVKPKAMITLISGIVNVIGVFALSKIMGVVGAGVSISIAMVVKYILLFRLLHRDLHVHLSRIWTQVYGKGLVPIAAVLICGIVLRSWFSVDTWMQLILSAICLTIVYCAIAFLMNRQEFIRLCNELKKRKAKS